MRDEWDAMPTDPVEAAVTDLRREWLDECRAGFPYTTATGRVRGLVNRAPSHQAAEDLRAILARLEAYRGLSVARRKEELPGIANALKALGPALRAAGAPGPEIGRLAPAPRAAEPLKPAPPTSRAASPPRRSPASPPPAPRLRLDDPVTVLPKVGTGVAAKLAKLGVATIGDLVELRPRRHDDYGKTLHVNQIFELRDGEEVTVRGEVVEVQEVTHARPPRTDARIADRTGTIRVTWFTPYVARSLFVGDQIAIHGVPDLGYGRISFTRPEWERLADGGPIAEGRLAPVYGLTEGISQKTLREHVARAVLGAVDQVEEWLPEEVRTRLGAGEDGPLPMLSAALREIHLPTSLRELERAQRRLAFDQLLLLQVGQVRRKQERKAHGGIPLPTDRALLRRFRASLPYRLTGAQDRALGEILADLEAERPMSRLLQGDVGSGKTVVAAAAMVVARANGRQSAMMAPTEILAEQHFHNLSGLFSGLPDADRPTVALLTGSTRAKARRETLAAAAAGEVDVLVGTHTLIQEGVALPRLGLSVVDEQHRFGVRQRATLPVQGEGDDVLPHQLSMTATPIPRTLNMVLNGDLDVSVIDELPPGREPIETRRFVGSQREEAYALVREQVRAGRQVFVICPLVEASEAIEAKAAVEEAERLRREVFPDLRIATLHGRMSGRDKEAVMTAFRDREHDILVSTSVIEVGVDVPNATVMLIEGADRFGLAQLHQFRGRVGRGGGKSWCLLLADETTPDADARLEMMAQTNDGFLLAEKDLELRGPGDFLGTRQSGLPELTWIDGAFDSRLLDRAQRTAEALLADDPDLSQPGHSRLRDRVEAFWAKASPDLPIVG